VHFDESRDKGWRNALQISAEFGHSDIAAQIGLVDALERSQEVADIRPHAFHGVDMNFTNAISVVITCPFSFCMADGSVGTDNVVVRAPLIGIDLTPDVGVLVDMFLQRLSVGAMHHA